MSKHTPGPWVIKFRNDHSAYISMGDPSSEHKQFDIEFDDRYPSDVADALLIAAAPDMLRALRKAVVALAGACVHAPELYAHETYETVSAAIAKATDPSYAQDPSTGGQ